MHVFLYEWVTGGGLIDHHGVLPESLASEGRAMIQSVAADAAQAGMQATLLRDIRLPTLVGHGAELIEIDSRTSHDDEFERLAKQADWTLIIAPEIDETLLRLVQRAESVGARLLSPHSDFVSLASDKQLTGERMSEAGVPMPNAVRIEPDTSLPEDFTYPAVIKPLDGAGSQDTHAVARSTDRPPAYAWPRRLEQYVPGIAVSVSVIGNAVAEPVALTPCRQRIANDGRFTYQGGSTRLATGLARRATELALRAVAAMPPLVGYAGVDLILGADPKGREDRVIEINPRLTTSYVGLRAAAQGNLIAMMVAAAGGKTAQIEFDSRPVAFDADGAVYFDEDD